jgi:hypothetical protein
MLRLNALWLVAAVAAVAAGAPSSAAASAWEDWIRGLNVACPERHVAWVADGGYSDLLGAYDATLPEAMRRRVSRTADAGRRCADTGGYMCEMAVTLDALEKFGLLRKFVAFGCRTVRCEEIAVCSEFPGR